MHSKKGILGLSTTELLGLILAAILLGLIFFLGFLLFGNVFNTAGEAGAKASFETLSTRLTNTMNKAEPYSSTVMPYNIAKVEKSWSEDPFFVFLGFDNGQDSQISDKTYKNPTDVCGNFPCLCICSTKEDEIKDIEENVCTMDKETRICQKFNPDYTLKISNGLLGPEIVNDLEIKVINVQTIQYGTWIYIYPGISYSEAIKKNVSYSISYQIVEDAIRLYENREYDKSIYFLKQVLEKYADDYGTPVFSVAKCYLALDYRDSNKFVEASEQFEDWYDMVMSEVSFIPDDQAADARFSKQEIENKKREYADNRYKLSKEWDMCYAMLSYGFDQYKAAEYNGAITASLLLLDKCKDTKYSALQCFAYKYISASYSGINDNTKSEEYRLKSENECPNSPGSLAAMLQ